MKEKYWKKTGGFGCFLHLATNWADFDNTKKSYELFARYAVPKFTNRNSQRINSLKNMKKNSDVYSESYRAASQAAIDSHFSNEVKGSIEK